MSKNKNSNFSTQNVSNFKPFLPGQTSKPEENTLKSNLAYEISWNRSTGQNFSGLDQLQDLGQNLPSDPEISPHSPPPREINPEDLSHPILTFNSNFESGNLGKVEAVNRHEYNLEIRQDTNNSKYRLWYYFSVENFVANQVVLFNLTNFSKGKSLYRSGQSPVFKINQDGKWMRVNPAQGF